MWEFDGWCEGSNKSELTQAVNNMEETAISRRRKKKSTWKTLKGQKEKKERTAETLGTLPQWAKIGFLDEAIIIDSVSVFFERKFKMLK